MIVEPEDLVRWNVDTLLRAHRGEFVDECTMIHGMTEADALDCLLAFETDVLEEKRAA